MEKIKEKTIKKKEYTHTFYCDCCNKKLGDSIEYEDGWYETIGELELSFNLGEDYGYWYKVSKHLCDECRTKYMKNLINILKENGFEED